MKDPVKVTVNDTVIEVDRATQERWPEDYPLAETKAGKPTAAAKRAKAAAPTPDTPPPSGETAGDIETKEAD